jgi:hypothetical protein
LEAHHGQLLGGVDSAAAVLAEQADEGRGHAREYEVRQGLVDITLAGAPLVLGVIFVTKLPLSGTVVWSAPKAYARAGIPRRESNCASLL